MKTTMKKLMFAALAALACAVVPFSAAAAVGDPCTLEVYIDPGPQAGTIAVSGAGTQRHVGDTVTVQATAKDGYTFICWENLKTTEVRYENRFSFVLEGDTEWSALFRKNGEYFIFVSKPWPGLTATPSLSSYAPGTPVTLSAPAISGRSIVYEIARDVDGQSSSVTWTRLSGNVFTMPAYDTWVRALYSINIAASGDEHGTVALSPSGPYYEGDTVTVTITPDSGYRAKAISGIPKDTVISGNTATFTLGNYYDLDIHVDFEKIPGVTFKAYVSPLDGGTVAVTQDGDAGNYVATAMPNNGYHFLCWINLDNNSILSTANSYTFQATDDLSICAFFYLNVAVDSKVEHGSLEVVNPKQAYAAGDTVTLLGHPDDGYAVDYYAVGEIHDGSATLQRLEGNSFVMPPWDMLVSAVFVPGYAVSAAASTEGTGTVVGAGSYKPGSTVTLIAEPAEGYTFTGWEENGAVVSTERNYSFIIQANRNLTANFRSYAGMSFTINADAVPAAGGTITGTGTYAGGETVTLTALPAPGYSFLGWSEYGQTIGTDAVYSFTANGNRTLTATFLAGVKYVNAAGSELICENFTTISSATTAMNTGWYAVAGNVTISDRITVTGNVNLILCDGAALNAMRGITVAEGACLTIWGQGGEHAVPGTAVTTRGTGTLFAQTYSQAAAIGGEKNGSTGDIVINGGVVTARGVWGAGIGRGDVADGSVGSVTINGGHVDASGDSGSAGIGSGAYGDSCPVTITGGYVLATGCVYGSQATPGIGTGRPRPNGSQPLSNGTITITGGTVVAQAGETPSGGTAAQAIGVNAADAAYNGTGHLVLGDVRVYASADAALPVAVSARGDTCRGTWVKVEACASHQDGNADVFCDYCGGYCGPVPPIGANGIFLIGSTDDWDVFAASVAAGKRYTFETVKLTADIAVTTMVGTSDHPFGGTFDGCGHTLTVTIDSSNQAAAPFGKIDGATIKTLAVAGTVTSSAYHAAGLVGGCGNDHPNTILNCTVAAIVNGSGYAGGIVGHGGEGTLTLDGCVFSGTVSGFDTCAGGLLGWCDALTLTITNCLCTGAFTPAGEGKYHPIACRYAHENVTATVADAYYLNTIVPTVLGVNPTVTTSNLIPGAEGTPVSATLVAGEWAQPVTAADGNEYYGWTTAPAGRLIAHYAFDDTGNGGLNLLHASVGLDAIVRATQTTPVAGIGEMVAVTDAAILSGLSAGDGAVSIPNGQHLAVPVPAALLSAPGRPYTIVMKIRVPNTVGWRSLLNMPASNDTDAMVYLQRTTRNVYLKQFSKVSGEGIAAANGFVPADQWTTLTFAFGENATDVYLDGTPILHTDGALAGSYADCAAAGGYILVGADDSGDDDLFYLSDFRIYEGAVAVAGILPGSGTPTDPYLISSTADWDIFAANVNAGINSDACYCLAADIAITTTVGTSDHPFGGIFDGDSHKLTANLSGTDAYIAPFSAIGGATIQNVRVSGSVSGSMHCSGLVGVIVNGVNVIENCEVTAAITSSGSHFGGFIGHSVTNAVTLRGCVFSGSLSGGTYVATFHGWSDDGAATTLIDCLDVSESTQPIGRGHDAACVSNTYYFASKNFSNRERLWSEGKRGKRAYAVTAGEGVAIDLGAPTAAYGTSGVTAYATGLAFGDNFYAASGETVSLGVAYTGVPASGTILDGFAVSAGDLVRDGDGWRLTMPDANVAISAVFRAATGYGVWAAANGITGAWDATDASGIPNVFRYAFNKPTGDFALLGISFNGDGKVVIVTPPLVNGEGIALSIIASDNVNGGGGVATTPLDPSGKTVINETGKKKRFFRLRAAVK